MKGIFKGLAILLVAGFLYAGIIINEVNFYPDTWIEIYNSTPYEADLDGFELITPSGAYSLQGIRVEANSYIVLSRTKLFPERDYTVDFELSNSGGFLILVNGNTVYDFVNWGMITNEWKNSHPYLWDDAPFVNMNLSRYPDGQDTDQPSDFRNTDTPTPLSPNAPMGLDPVSWSRIKALFRDAHKRM